MTMMFRLQAVAAVAMNRLITKNEGVGVVERKNEGNKSASRPRKIVNENERIEIREPSLRPRHSQAQRRAISFKVETRALDTIRISHLQ